MQNLLVVSYQSQVLIYTALILTIVGMLCWLSKMGTKNKAKLGNPSYQETLREAHIHNAQSYLKQAIKEIQHIDNNDHLLSMLNDIHDAVDIPGTTKVILKRDQTIGLEEAYKYLSSAFFELDTLANQTNSRTIACARNTTAFIYQFLSSQFLLNNLTPPASIDSNIKNTITYQGQKSGSWSSKHPSNSQNIPRVK